MPQFAYLGDHGGTDVFGHSFPYNVAVEVTDAHAVSKLRGNPDFSEVFDEVQVLDPVSVEPKRRGRPRKVE